MRGATRKSRIDFWKRINGYPFSSCFTKKRLWHSSASVHTTREDEGGVSVSQSAKTPTRVPITADASGSPVVDPKTGTMYM
jgi:hypothetical protein